MANLYVPLTLLVIVIRKWLMEDGKKNNKLHQNKMDVSSFVRFINFNPSGKKIVATIDRQKEWTDSMTVTKQILRFQSTKWTFRPTRNIAGG